MKNWMLMIPVVGDIARVHEFIKHTGKKKHKSGSVAKVVHAVASPVVAAATSIPMKEMVPSVVVSTPPVIEIMKPLSLPTAVQGRNIWDFVASQVQQALIGVAIGQAQKVGQYFLMRAMELFGSKEEENLLRLTAAVATAEPTVQNHHTLMRTLDVLGDQFQQVVQGRHQTADHALQALSSNRHVVVILNNTVTFISEKDLEAALVLMSQELEAVINEHGQNVMMLPKVVDALEQSAVEQREAQMALQSAKNELEVVAYELEALRLLIEEESLLVGENIDAVVRGLNDV